MRNYDQVLMETTASPAPGDRGPSLVGRLLDGRYRLDSIIDRGGMATVYSAIDTRLERIVAVKVMHRYLAEDPEFVARFTREAQSAAKVAIPEVVAVHDTGTDPDTGLAYLVMELVRGQNLRKLIQATRAMRPAEAIRIMEPVLTALAAAHQAGLVHRDIKPENILVGDNGRVKVVDFGLARAIESTNITQAGADVLGTASYLAPEQASTGTGSERADVYSAGIVLWELLTGFPPYAGDTVVQVALKHQNEDVPAPSTEVPGIPPALDALVVRATRRDPSQRPADGAQFLAELQQVSKGLPLPAPVPVQGRTLVVPRVAPVPLVVEPESKPARKRRTGLIAALLVLLLGLLALGGGYYLGSYRYTNAPSVLGMTLTQAEAKLRAEHLKVKLGKAEFSDQVDKDHILKQNPNPNGRVRKNGTVTLIESLGPDLRVVPSFSGKTLAQATAALKAVGLAVAPNHVSVYNDTVPAGQVIKSDPLLGVKLRPGSTVALTISKGPQPIPVPNLAKESVQDAEHTLDGLHLTYEVVQQFSDTVPIGIVIDNDPNSGTTTRGAQITLTVSKGVDLVTVPNIPFGTSPSKAKQLIEAAGLVPKRHDAFLSSGSFVYNISPGSGTKLKRGSTVTYYVS